jgi:hypothetical protein
LANVTLDPAVAMSCDQMAAGDFPSMAGVGG